MLSTEYRTSDIKATINVNLLLLLLLAIMRIGESKIR